MKERPGAGKDVTRIELHAKFSSGEMEVNSLNNVFALGYHHHGHWSPLIRIPIILNRRTNEKLSIIYSVTGSEHKTKKASMVSCHKRLRQLCFYPSFFTAFSDRWSLFTMSRIISYQKTFSCKEIGKKLLCAHVKELYFFRDSGMIEGFVSFVLDRFKFIEA